MAEINGVMRPLAVIQTLIGPKVTPPRVMGDFYKIFSKPEMQAKLRQELARIARAPVDYYADGANPGTIFPFMMTCLVAAFITAHDPDITAPASRIINDFELLNPATAFGPETSNISFGVVDVTDPGNLKGSFVFPFGIPSEWQPQGATQQTMGNHYPEAHASLDCHKYLDAFPATFFDRTAANIRPGLPGCEPKWSGDCYYNYGGVEIMVLYRLWPRLDGTWALPCHPVDWNRNLASMGPCPCGCDADQFAEDTVMDDADDLADAAKDASAD